MSPQRTLHSYMSGNTQMTVNTYKFFQDSVMKSTVAATLKEAFDYCQATFNLTPLGIQVPKRDVSNIQISADGTIPYCISLPLTCVEAVLLLILRLWRYPFVLNHVNSEKSAQRSLSPLVRYHSSKQWSVIAFKHSADKGSDQCLSSIHIVDKRSDH